MEVLKNDESEPNWNEAYFCTRKAIKKNESKARHKKLMQVSRRRTSLIQSTTNKGRTESLAPSKKSRRLCGKKQHSKVKHTENETVMKRGAIKKWHKNSNKEEAQQHCWGKNKISPNKQCNNSWQAYAKRGKETACRTVSINASNPSA